VADGPAGGELGVVEEGIDDGDQQQREEGRDRRERGRHDGPEAPLSGDEESFLPAHPRRPPATRLRKVEIRPPVVVSDVGARATLVELRGGRLDDPTVRALEAQPPGPSCVTLYLGLRESASRLGFRGENHWIHKDWDHDALVERADELLEGRATMAYLSFPSLKDSRAKKPTAEIIAFLDYEPFAAWHGSEWKRRGRDYEALKERIAQALLDLVERRHPGFRDLVEYHELSTPLSVESMTGHRGGQIYALPWTPERMRHAWPGPRTPTPGLHLTGADIAAHGIVGALSGGFLTAAALLGPLGTLRILRAARVPQVSRDPHAAPGSH
jgi:all-trans-retinol 13,14-reductase